MQPKTVKTSRGNLPVYYGWGALAKYSDLAGITLDQIVTLDLNSMTLTENFQLMLVGFQEGARKAGVECKVNTVEEVSDLLDEDGDILGKMIKAFTEMSLSGNAKPADPDEAKKK
jgi:hypothetical protein